jgi:hypothetical protein
LLRPLVAATGGARVVWLAGLNPEWSFLLSEVGIITGVADDDLAAWDDGPIGQRVGYVHDARRHDPDRARALLESTWAEESPEDRIRLLSALRVGLGLGDEPFLESTLDDRRREVRALAAELLATLPGSAYAKRMAERARAVVTPRGGRLRIAPPVLCDAAMRRDGIAPRPPSGVGERAWWLEEVLARTPLETWAHDPATFLRLDVDGDWAPVLHRGLARAASSQRSPDWAAALLDVLEPQVTSKSGPDEILLLEALYETLAPADRAARAVRALGQANPPGLTRLLELCPAPWPAPLAQAFCANVLKSRRVGEWCRIAATRLPLDDGLVEALMAQLSPGDTADRRAVEQLAGTLSVRREMNEELT